MCSPALAETSPPGTFRVASRLFLAPDLPGLYREEEGDFLPITEMDWLRELLDADPILDPTVLHISRLPSPPAWLFSESSMAVRYGNRERVPEHFRAQGLVSATHDGGDIPTRFHYRPDVPEPDFIARCTINRDVSLEAFSFCSVLASYPPDPAITLMARLYNPAPFDELQFDFERIADRMREVAYCLDVTEAPPAAPEELLRDILAEHPGLAGCGPDLCS